MKKKQYIGLSRGGKNTKIHALVDGLGNPIRLIFTGGEVHDSKEAVSLLEGYDIVDNFETENYYYTYLSLSKQKHQQFYQTINLK